MQNSKIQMWYLKLKKNSTKQLTALMISLSYFKMIRNIREISEVRFPFLIEFQAAFFVISELLPTSSMRFSDASLISTLIFVTVRFG